MTNDDLINKLTGFISSVGLDLYFEHIEEATVLPGIQLRNGAMVVDRARLLYPGDLLHEAGHLAVLPASVRRTMSDRLASDDIQLGGEIMAFAWSYAACVYLEIDPHIVFHAHGYQGGGEYVVSNFTSGNTVGVPLMEWFGLTYTKKTADELGKLPYPHMQKWVCDRELPTGDSA
ncbi:hypothetical protein [Hufsiella ginkgonis]|uniref:Uncharacterized protein n=1 Tax=Hufsiella ginkgonis TaxID=2695274 RepID=A0A7K1Y1B8_9SPHI|nr:hypothetical protein [Hufsiella ginkgonis]MXV17044.1 hypothetical protein [Hufsiella ginkgonis]